VNLLVRNATVVTMNAAREILRGADILIERGRIAQVGRGIQPSRRILQTLDATDRVVLPGLVHGHLHACQTLFRNHADGLALLEWLRQRIWPLEAAHDEASMRASAELTFVELIRSGATAALDMGTVRHTEVIFDVARSAGFRLTGGKSMMDVGGAVPAQLRETTSDSLSESLQLLKSWHGVADGRLRYALAPRFALSCTEDLLRDVATLARELGVRVHTHASENQVECALVRERTGRDNVDFLHSTGISGPQVTLAHGVWLTPGEHRLLRDTRTVVCHCPSSNLKLASGIAPIPELIAEGVTVALGADGAACNNNLDMFVEMRLAALIHAPRAGPRAMPPRTVLELATLGGARALGLEAEIGSIESGKRADLTVLELSDVHATPGGDDLYAQLVYSGRSTDVRDVIIDGRVVMRDREILTLDAAAVAARARMHAARVGERATEPKR
jgi:5-methylthioadenosine/S-adenosylhomocysteine deaminase